MKTPETGIALLNNINSNQYTGLSTFLDDAFQDFDLSKPKAHLVYIYFDHEMNIATELSGVLQVGDANSLGQLAMQSLMAPTDGFLYTYVTNQSAGKVNFDNMTIKHWKPMVRVTYDYYPYGLTWTNPPLPGEPEGAHDCAYQDKEFQFAEFTTGHGLALYDFHARMYDPCTARWFAPDPAAQFANPYLAMGNSPMLMIDPDGQFVWAPVIIGAVIGAVVNGISYAQQGKNILEGAIIGAMTGALGGILGQFGGGTFLNQVLWGGVEGAITGGFGAALNGQDVGRGMILGGAIGLAFGVIAACNEVYKNVHDGYGFHTNDKVFDKLVNDASIEGLVPDHVDPHMKISKYRYIDDNRAQAALDYWELRFGGPHMTVGVGSTAGPDGTVTIGAMKFAQVGEVRRAISHETGHWLYDVDWVDKPGGAIKDPTKWKNGPIPVGKDGLNIDGPSGYPNSIRRAGNYHTPIDHVKGSPSMNRSFLQQWAWDTYGPQWINQIPVRYLFFHP